MNLHLSLLVAICAVASLTPVVRPVAAAAAAATNESSLAYETYKGYSVLRLKPQSYSQLDELKKLLDNHDNDGLDFWVPPTGVNRSVDIMATPDASDRLQKLTNEFSIPIEVLHRDLGESIEEANRRQVNTDAHLRSAIIPKGPLSEDSGFFDKFQPYSEIEQKLSSLSEDPNVRVEVAGNSYENNKIYLVKVSSDFLANKPVIFIDAGHHAREWISHSTLMYLLGGLLDEGSFSDNLRSHLDNYDFWFVPVVNPDGYKFSMEKQRMWRKTTSPTRNSRCKGVDLNRNYDILWRSESSACSESFPGDHVFSESESQILANILDQNANRIAMYFTLHSYGQMILYPWGNTDEKAPNSADLERIAKAGVASFAQLRGTKYTQGTSVDLLYPAFGCSDDYAYGKSGIKYVFTIELADKGRSGFILPPREIVPVGKETLLAISSMIDTMRSLNRRRSRRN